MWTKDQTTLLAAILDLIIPASADGRVPGAGQLGVAGFLPKATPYAPDPVGAAKTVMAFVQAREDFAELDSDEKVEVLKLAEAAAPEAFATLVRLTYMGYYSRPNTRPLFGVGAHPVHPLGYEVLRESEDVLAELTAPVRERGPIYRDPTKKSAL